MSRLAIPTRDDAPAASRADLDRIHDVFGKVPAVYRLVASSPAVLSGLTRYSQALKGVLSAKTRERIALAVAQLNGCDYCLSAHHYVSLNMARLSPEEIALSRQGRSSDAKADAAIRFAVKVANERGHVGNDDIDEVRTAGFTDVEIVEIIAVIAETMFFNMLNEVAQTEIDFPVIRSGDAQ